MPHGMPQASATIYQFPTEAVRMARAAGDAWRGLAAAEQPRALPVAFGSGWYHDEAIREERRGFDA